MLPLIGYVVKAVVIVGVPVIVPVLSNVNPDGRVLGDILKEVIPPGGVIVGVIRVIRESFVNVYDDKEYDKETWSTSNESCAFAVPPEFVPETVTDAFV